MAERKAAFTKTETSAPTTPQTGSSLTSTSTGRTYRVPTTPTSAKGSAGPSTPTSHGDSVSSATDSSSMTATLAQRMQAYEKPVGAAANASTSPMATSASSASPGDNRLNIHAASISLVALISELASNPDRIDEKDYNGRSPLLAACFGKRWDAARYLIENGADVTIKDKVIEGMIFLSTFHYWNNLQCSLAPLRLYFAQCVGK
jgi:hypothetical protein